MATARQKVLAHLKKTRTASAREIARALKMSAPTIRHHLGILLSDSRIQLAEVRSQGGRGRPEKLYSLSQAVLGDNLAVLTRALLTEAGSKVDGEALAGHILDMELFANLPVQKRLGLLVEKLNEMNYQARWEAGAEGPRVILGRCPYAKVIDGNSEICKMDETMLRNALSRPVTSVRRAELPLQGACPFLFQTG